MQALMIQQNMQAKARNKFKREIIQKRLEFSRVIINMCASLSSKLNVYQHKIRVVSSVGRAVGF